MCIIVIDDEKKNSGTKDGTVEYAILPIQLLRHVLSPKVLSIGFSYDFSYDFPNSFSMAK